MIQVTLNFTSEQDLLAFFANKKAMISHQPGLPLETGEFIPAAELNKPKAEANARKLLKGIERKRVVLNPGAASHVGEFYGDVYQVGSTVVNIEDGKEDEAFAKAEALLNAGKAPAAEPAEAPASAASTAAPTESQIGTVEYPVLKKAVFTLAGKSREAAAEVAQSFGVETFKELDASKWGVALAAVNAKIAELG